jgi:hypothetical protein
MRDPSATPPNAPATVPGGILVASALLAVIALTHHPVAKASHGADVFRQIRALAPLDRAVHGAMIAVTALLVFALCVFAQRRGLRRPWNLFALIAYALGAVAIIGAALADGFFVPEIGLRFGTPADAASGIALLRLCAIAIQIFTKLGLIAMAVAFASWSADLIGGKPPLRVTVTAAVGSAAVATQAAIVAFGGPAITASSIVWIVGAQACWYVAVGTLLIRGDV